MPNPTTRNRFRKPDPGADNNTWGSNLNQAMFDLIDDSLDGVVEISASGTTTLTNTQYVANQARMRTIKYTANTNGTIIIPSVEKWYIVYSPNADVVISAGAVTATVKAGDCSAVFCDGADCRLVKSTNFQGSEIKNIGPPTSNTSATNKAYVDGLAFAAGGALPGINVGTTDQFVTNNGSTAYWGDALPTRDTTSLNKTLKSLGNSAGTYTSTTWDWDGFQGVVDKSSDYTVVLADRQLWINCTAALTLSLAAGGTLGTKFIFRAINSTTASNVTVDPNGSETINGTSTLTILPGESWDIVWNGTSWSAQAVAQTSVGWDVIVQDQKTNNTSAGTDATTTAYTTRTLNTVVRSVISGVSLSSDQVTLPAGTWLIKAFSPALSSIQRIAIYNVTDSSYSLIGPGAAAATINGSVTARVEGYVTITGSKAFEVRQWRQSSPGAGNLGSPVNSGDPEIYTQFFAKRVAP